MIVLSWADCFAAFPPVRNFTRASYSWGTQNWAITQDSTGVMYFGNKNGLMIFNSNKWRTFVLDNQSTIRCIELDAELKRIYAGGSEDFGYFSIDPETLKTKYTSMSPGLPEGTASIGEIWNIFRSDNDLIFQGDHAIYSVGDSGAIKVIELGEKITCTKMINGKLFIALNEHGLGRLQDDQYEKIDDNGLLKNKKIVSIQQIMGRIMLITEHNGIFTYDGASIKPYDCEINGFLSENQAFCACTDGKSLAIGTVNRGLVIWNPVENSATYVNTDSGMQNNTVLSVFFDRDNNIWCGLDNGIDYVIYNSPFQSIFGINGNYGTGYVSLMKENTLYLGTNQGLFTIPYPLTSSPENLKSSRIIQGQVWDIKEIGECIAISCDGGLYMLKGDRLVKVKGIPGSWAVRSLNESPGYALVSTYDNFYLIRNNGAEWVSLGPVTGFNDCNGRFEIDSDNNIWICHWLKGIYRLKLDLRAMRVDHVRFFDSSRGLPSEANTSIWRHDDKLVFSTEGGYYSYNERTDRMTPIESLNRMFPNQRCPHLYTAPSGNLWSITPDNIIVAHKKLSGAIEIDSVSFSSLGQRIVPGFDNFNFLSDDRIIISALDGFLDLDLNRTIKPVPGASTFINRVYANQDSLLYIHESSRSGLELPYTLNSLRFEFVTPEYASENSIHYSCYLENYDRDWSPYTPSTAKEYTQLPEGTYTMHVRSQNILTKAESEDAITFTILPPWYLSLPAKFSYLLALILFAWAIYDYIKGSTRRTQAAIEMKKEKEMNDMKRAVQEESLRKDYEIADLKNQQLEQDIKHKGEELSNITMNVVRKNEILINIAGRLTKLQKSLDGLDVGTDVNAEFAKIQTIIQENISHDDDWKTFTHNFDAAYEDFTQRLKSAHPGLTPTELRTCCYLRMGLSSKEMAPLFNISYRSVEMTRYRLRKKLGLDRETNLSDYLREF